MSDSFDQIQNRLTDSSDGASLILDITQRIAAGGSLNELLPDVIRIALKGSEGDGVRIILNGPSLPITYSAGPATSKMAPFDALLWRVVADGGTTEIPDIANDPAPIFAPMVGSIGALLALPLSIRDMMDGVLWVAYDHPRSFTAAEKTFVAVVCGQAGIAIANAYAFDAARRGREQLAAILSSSADPILVINEEHEIVLINPAAERVFSVAGGAVTGRPVQEVLNAEPLIELLKNDDSGTDSTESVEWQNEAGLTFAPRVSDVLNDHGKRTGRVLMLRDITRFKTLRDNQSEFVSTVSHDLRSPLAYMHGFAQMLPMVGTLNDKQKGFADKILVGIAQMTDLVEKILDAGRLDPEGKYQLNRETCDVAKMVTEIVDMNVQHAEKKGIALTANVDGGLPILNLDQVMLRRAVNNLVDNAIKYTPEHGTVSVIAEVANNHLMLSVKDTGLGISPENQKRLFERFQRIRRREHQAVKGSGLGLFIVKSVAQRHGGDAWVESVEGQGSSFNIKIPLDGPNLVGAGTSDGKRS